MANPEKEFQDDLATIRADIAALTDTVGKLASEAGNAARNGVREWARMEDISAYDARARRGILRNLVVREGRRTGQIQTRLVTTAERLPRPPVDLHTTIEGDSGGTDGPTGALGEERLHEELCGLQFEMSHGAFFQTNTEMAERLYAVAQEFAGLTGRERVFDLFCGIGTIGLSMAGAAGEVWGLEIVPEAIEDAERNAERNNIGNAKFVAGNAREAVGERTAAEESGMSDARWWEIVGPELAAVIPDGAYPLSDRVGSAVGEIHQAPGAPDDAFEFGLARVLDGLRPLLA